MYTLALQTNSAPLVDIGASVVLWTVLGLYLAGDLYWIYEMLWYGIRYRPPARQYGARDAQVRILTVNNESVVRETVRRLPDSFDERYVIAEEPMDVPGADVRVVPDDFECNATNKGRALEWARQTLSCDREFVLYLDEDSHLLEFGGFPDADIVQFNEHPRRTTSLLAYLCEINRIGFQIEQRAFPSLKIPLYAWGGGIAIRKSVEDEITWDYPTVIEDTVFVWRVFSSLGRSATLTFVPDRISNQSPPSIPAMFRQRRRWIAGSREDNDLLSLDRILMYGIRDLSWSVTGVIPILALLAFLPGIDVFFGRLYAVASVVLLGFMYVWIVIGLLRYRPPAKIAVAVVVLAPLTTVLHSLGALWGLVSTPDTFEVTAKVDDESQFDEAYTTPQGEAPTEQP
ncbi:glycosyltransferase [Natronomonas marina]|uniref:glycosyltransferase n=1 Tax=Natronomonas marina TaxID=2961939 RepID=UPI0020C99D25|nr:glycosyltransferase family 2 protein [Natronomonas marina]